MVEEWAHSLHCPLMLRRFAEFANAGPCHVKVLWVTPRDLLPVSFPFLLALLHSSLAVLNQ